MQIALPTWISPVEGKVNTFVVDPDLFYPEILADMGVETPDRADLEIASEVMKLDFDLALKLARVPLVEGATIVRLVRADDGRKARWNHTMHAEPPAEKAVPQDMRARARLVREVYRRIRGVVSAG